MRKRETSSLQDRECRFPHGLVLFIESAALATCIFNTNAPDAESFPANNLASVFGELPRQNWFWPMQSEGTFPLEAC